jgi:hypothetical protein
MHRKEPAAESIEQLTEESDRNQPTVDLADRRRAGDGRAAAGRSM